MKNIKKAWVFAKGEWRRQFSDAKIYVVMLCLFLVLIITMGDMPELVRKSGERVGIFELFPLYWNGMNLPGAYFAVYLLLVCDIPSRGLGMRNHVMRAGRKAYFWGEMIYLSALTTLYLLFMWFVSLLPFYGRWSITMNEWSSVVTDSKFGSSSFGLDNAGYITNGTPWSRFWQCMVVIWLCCFLMGMVCVVVNMISGSVAGCVVCAFFLMVHITVMNLLGEKGYPWWLYFCSPITTTWAYAGSITCSIGEACLYYLVMIFLVMQVGRISVKRLDV
jgi:hypothetical protein